MRSGLEFMRPWLAIVAHRISVTTPPPLNGNNIEKAASEIPDDGFSILLVAMAFVGSQNSRPADASAGPHQNRFEKRTSCE
jgi:hypothetical protein